MMDDGGWHERHYGGEVERSAEGAICKGASIMEWMVPLEGVYSPTSGNFVRECVLFAKAPPLIK